MSIPSNSLGRVAAVQTALAARKSKANGRDEQNEAYSHKRFRSGSKNRFYYRLFVNPSWLTKVKHPYRDGAALKPLVTGNQ
jgi:hypothetical protein